MNRNRGYLGHDLFPELHSQEEAWGFHLVSHETAPTDFHTLPSFTAKLCPLIPSSPSPVFTSKFPPKENANTFFFYVLTPISSSVH